jgi:hypothetical protein
MTERVSPTCPERVQLYRYDVNTYQYIPTRVVTPARPDLYHTRGSSICWLCGQPTRTVLDGETWCDNCRHYS